MATFFNNINSLRNHRTIAAWLFGLLATFGDVESVGTFTGEIKKRPLRNGAVFVVLSWTGKRCKSSQNPHFTKSGQEPDLTCKIALGGGTRHHGSADHLVGLEEEGGGDRQAKGLGGLEVDD
jgi:hypothetical protein